MTKDFIKHSDKIVVGHIYNPTKEYLPYNMKQGNIFETYEALLMAKYPSSKFRLHWEEKDPDITTVEQMRLTALNHEISFVAVGWHGCKGPKGY